MNGAAEPAGLPDPSAGSTPGADRWTVFSRTSAPELQRLEAASDGQRNMRILAVEMFFVVFVTDSSALSLG
jgi:hypothetical protein